MEKSIFKNKRIFNKTLITDNFRKNFSSCLKVNNHLNSNSLYSIYSKHYIHQLNKNFSTNKKKDNYNDDINTKKNIKPPTRKESILFDIFPSKYHPYIRLGRFEKPVGWLLLYIPCTWGLTLGYPVFDSEYLYRFFLFMFGAITMRSCGCAINDYFDRDFDKHVERTKTRPLAAGDLSPKQAIKFIIAHFAIGLAVLLQFKYKSIITGFLITPVFIIYPLMKRYTNFPQFFLGLCFNSGVFVGYTAVNNLLNPLDVIPIYFAGILWTLIYDTYYGHMDKKDDIRIGVNSTALKFAEHTKSLSYIFLACIFLLFSYYINKRKSNKQLLEDSHEKINDNTNQISKKKYVPNVALILACLYEANLIRTTDINNVKSCLKFFNKNIRFGFMLTAVLLLDNQYNN